MRTISALVLALVCISGFAQVAIPTRYIVPQEVVQNSIRLVRFPTSTNINTLVVRFTYTEAGATNMLAFQEAHEGQKVRTMIGTFESPLHEMQFRAPPPGVASYEQWKKGWLANRTDKFFVQNEDDARKIMAGLKAE